MATTLSVVISMMTEDGLAVGECMKVNESELHFFTASRLGVGKEMEFRLELDGADVTVLGNMRVYANAGHMHWRAKILNIHPDDRAVWEAWNCARREGRVISMDHRAVGEGLLGQAPARADSAANLQALARMEARKERFAKLRSSWKADEDDLFVAGAFELSPVRR